MCCRYWVDDSPELQPFVEAMNRSPLIERFVKEAAPNPSGEVRPTDIAPVVALNKSGERRVFPMKWGFAGRSLLINARVETAAERPTFREAWQAHRCIVPARGYFEWAHIASGGERPRAGDKYLIRPRDGGMAWMCGLYRMEAGLPVFVILTREAGAGIRFIHNRMPLMLPEALADAWIRPEAQPEALVARAVADMYFERVA